MEFSDADSDAVDEDTEAYLYSLIHYDDHNYEVPEDDSPVQTTSPIRSSTEIPEVITISESEVSEIPEVITVSVPSHNQSTRIPKKRANRKKRLENILDEYRSNEFTCDPNKFSKLKDSVKNSLNKSTEKVEKMMLLLREGAKSLLPSNSTSETCDLSIDNHSSLHDKSDCVPLLSYKKAITTRDIMFVSSSESSGEEIENLQALEDAIELYNTKTSAEVDYTLSTDQTGELTTFVSSESSCSDDESSNKEVDYSMLDKEAPSIHAVANDFEASTISLGKFDAREWKVEIKRGYQGNRYFDGNQSTCGICLKKGHFTSQCTRSGPVCILCGKEGHQHDTCKDVWCLGCGSPGHVAGRCPRAKFLVHTICMRCGSGGHDKKTCPDIWKQYHLTTRPGPPVKPTGKPHRITICCNCGKYGHTHNECRKAALKTKLITKNLYHTVIKYDKIDVYKNIPKGLQKMNLRQHTFDGPATSTPASSISQRLLKRKNEANSTSALSTSSTEVFNTPMSCRTKSLASKRTELMKSTASDFGDYTSFKKEKRSKASSKTPVLTKKALKRKKLVEKMNQDTAETTSSTEKIDLSCVFDKIDNTCSSKLDDPHSSTTQASRDACSEASETANGSFKAKLSLPQYISDDIFRRLFPDKTEGKEVITKTMRRNMRKKLKYFMSHGYVPGDDGINTERMESWLLNIADGESLSFKRRWRLLDSVSAALYSIAPRVSDECPTAKVPGQHHRLQRNGMKRKLSFSHEQPASVAKHTIFGSDLDADVSKVMSQPTDNSIAIDVSTTDSVAIDVPATSYPFSGPFLIDFSKCIEQNEETTAIETKSKSRKRKPISRAKRRRNRGHDSVDDGSP